MRRTKISIELERIFQESRKLMTVGDILKTLAQSGLKPNKTTIYRQLNSRVEKGQLDHVNLEGRGLAYESKTDHHHHLVCKNCDSIEDVKINNDLKLIEKKISKRSNFKIERHALEFFGLCAKCN